jgi:hypothetical protein
MTLGLSVYRGVIMAFPEKVVEQAWKRAAGKCECKRWTHTHNVVRCGKELVFAIRAIEGQGRWEAHRINRTAGDTLSNCEILCADCYKRTLYE